MVTKWGKIARLGAIPYSITNGTSNTSAYGYYTLPLATINSTETKLDYIYPPIEINYGSYAEPYRGLFAGAQQDLFYNISKHTKLNTAFTDSSVRLIYGHSAKPENIGDYTIYEPYDCITCSNISMTFNYQDATNKLQAIIIAALQTSMDIEINEVGCLKGFATTESAAVWKSVLIARNVLKQPIKVKANDFFTVTFIMEV